MILFFGDVITPDGAQGIKSPRWARRHDIMRIDIVVAYGRNNWYVREDLSHSIIDVLIQFNDFIECPRNRRVDIMSSVITHPNNEINLVPPVF